MPKAKPVTVTKSKPPTSLQQLATLLTLLLFYHAETVPPQPTAENKAATRRLLNNDLITPSKATGSGYTTTLRGRALIALFSAFVDKT